MLLYPVWNEEPKRRWRRWGIEVQLVEELNGVAISIVSAVPVATPVGKKSLTYDELQQIYINNSGRFFGGKDG